MIKEFTTFLAEQTGWTVGTDLFAGYRPHEAADLCVAVLENGEARVDPYLDDLEERTIEVLSRGSTYHTARDRATLAHDALDGLGACGRDLPSITAGTLYHLYAVETLKAPEWRGMDERQRHQWRAIYRVTTRLTTT